MYKGTENLIDDGTYLDTTILDYWQWAYSNLIQNMQRGSFAEFIVKTALDMAGLPFNKGLRNTIAPYDLDGPIIPSTKRVARLEIKSAAKVQLWDIKHPDRLTFSIAPAVAPDETGDYNEGAPKQRNNDVYVFAVYNGVSRNQNILDLSLWDFYVVSTYKLESDEHLVKQKSISLNAVKELSPIYNFSSLYEGILDAVKEIPSNFQHYTIPCQTS